MDAASHVSHSQDLDLQAINTALNRVQAVIEFELDGTILHANDNFLRVVGYTHIVIHKSAKPIAQCA